MTIERAREEMRAIAAKLARDFPRTNRDNSASVHPLRESMVSNVRQSMFVLLGAVGLVLLIVCVNIASLVLVRAIGRGRELAVRVAIGAGRASLVRSLLVESVLLGVLGGAAGLVLAYWATAAIASLDPSVGVPLLNQTRLDVTVVGFAMAVALIASIVFGTMPAWQATSIGDVMTRIREEGGSTTSDPKRQRMRSVLIVAETTLGGRAARRRGSAGAQFRSPVVGGPWFLCRCRPNLRRGVANSEIQPTGTAAAVYRNAIGADCGEPKRGIGRRHLRVAAVEFPVRDFHLHSRWRHPFGR